MKHQGRLIRNLSSLACYCGLFLSLNQAVVAEPFFPRDFAKSPLQNRDIAPTPPAESKHPSENEEKKSMLNLTHANPLISAMHVATADKQDSVPLTGNIDEGIPVISIGAIINSRDIDHFNTSLRELLSVAKKHDFQIGMLYGIGNIAFMFKDLPELMKVALRNGNAAPFPETPEEYQIHMSPTWVIETKYGDILVEGVTDIGRCFNEKGEFVERFATEPAR